jgi:hypothetical protein
MCPCSLSTDYAASYLRTYDSSRTNVPCWLSTDYATSYPRRYNSSRTNVPCWLSTDYATSYPRRYDSSRTNMPCWLSMDYATSYPRRYDSRTNVSLFTFYGLRDVISQKIWLFKDKCVPAHFLRTARHIPENMTLQGQMCPCWLSTDYAASYLRTYDSSRTNVSLFTFYGLRDVISQKIWLFKDKCVPDAVRFWADSCLVFFVRDK